METLSTGVWGALRAGIWPSLGGAGYRQGPCRASTNCHTKGLSPCRGLKCCPHSAHLPMGLDPGLIPPPLESFPVPARKDSSLWWVCLPALPLCSQSLREMTRAPAVQLTGRIQYPSRDLQRKCMDLQNPQKHRDRGRCGQPPSPENMRFRHGPKSPEATEAVSWAPARELSTLHSPFDFLGAARGSLVNRRRPGAGVQAEVQSY